ncbi:MULTISPECIES: alpha/beta fold hydrolase [unclassified Isoptericola]|uniref:alpha/beta fold hydrolase n=1 Tax=Isoptericola sp. NPDC057191 TaxID=3346041 RepID=UPI00363484EB
MSELTTHTLDVPGAVLTYDVRTPTDPSGHRPIFVLGSPMAASGFEQLVAELDDRVVITYDPRGTERSTLAPDGEVSLGEHAEDYHRIVAATGLGPVDVFGSSGGAAAALDWAVAHPEDLGTVVAHEPPLVALLPDGEAAAQALHTIYETYMREGHGPAMARFISLVMHTGPVTAEYLAQPAPDPAAFGIPAEDDGSRDDLLLGRNTLATADYRPDLDRVRASTVQIVPAIGEAGEGTFARRGGQALAGELGVEPVVFPGDHGGFVSNEWSPGNDPAAFAAQLRKVLAG